MRCVRGAVKAHVCKLVGVPRSTVDYEPKPRVRDERLKPILPELARKLPWSGYRPMTEVVCAAVEPISRNALQRLWQLLGLQRKPQRRKKRIRRKLPTIPGLRATAVNQVWCLDFMKDYTSDGRQLRFLSVVDEYTRECLALETGRRFRAEEVLDVLEGLMHERGTPAHVRSDNGPEFVASVVESWAKEVGIRLVRSAPGCPWQNAFSETFHSRVRDEFLEREVLGSEEEAEVLAEAYRRWYNEARPHSALGYIAPAVFAGKQDRSSSLFRDLVRAGYATS